jgi:hypothetical protein
MLDLDHRAVALGTGSPANSLTAREYDSSGHHLPMPSVKTVKARSGPH